MSQCLSIRDGDASRGLAIIGFPCNQFLGQEPGSAEGIRAFCRKNYGATFDMVNNLTGPSRPEETRGESFV